MALDNILIDNLYFVSYFWDVCMLINMRKANYEFFIKNVYALKGFKGDVRN